MVGTTFTERVGLEERLLQHLEENAKDLQARGLNVPYWTAALRASISAVKSADARQEALKAELKATTSSVNAADREAYTLASGLIDAIAAAWGKASEKGENITRMRSDLHRTAAEADILPVEPPPK